MGNHPTKLVTTVVVTVPLVLWVTLLAVAAPAPLSMGAVMTRMIIYEERKWRMNAGRIWTKIKVFRVAKLAFLEVIPIHIPYQSNAMRLATATKAERLELANCRAAPGPTTVVAWL